MRVHIILCIIGTEVEVEEEEVVSTVGTALPVCSSMNSNNFSIACTQCFFLLLFSTVLLLLLLVFIYFPLGALPLDFVYIELYSYKVYIYVLLYLVRMF